MDKKGMVIDRSGGRKRSRFGGWMLTQFQVALALVGVALSLLLFGGLGFLFGVWYQANENVRPHDDAIALAEQQLQREVVPKPSEQDLTFYSTLAKPGHDGGVEALVRPVVTPEPVTRQPQVAANAVSEPSTLPDPVVSSLQAEARAQSATEAPLETPDQQASAQVQTAPERLAADATVSPDRPPMETVSVPASPSAATVFTVQVGSFRSAADAERLQQILAQKGYVARRLNAAVPGKGIWHRVRVGKFSSQSEAKRVAQQLRSEERMSVLVTRESR